MDFPSLPLHGPELQISSKDCAVDTSLGLQKPTLGGRFSRGATSFLTGEMLLVGLGASLPPQASLGVQARTLPALCLLQVLWGPRWLLGLGCGVFLVPVLWDRYQGWVFGTCYDAFGFYRLIPEALRIPTSVCCLWVRAELQTPAPPMYSPTCPHQQC